jgi:hypothetical protein
LAASTTARASLRIRSGVAPTTPNDGDIWATTTDILARVNGANYSLIAGAGGGSMAIGGNITSATAGSVLFAGASGVLSQDNANLFWDDSNNRLGIGTNAPSGPLHINSDITNSTNGLTVTRTGISLADANFQIGNLTNNSGQYCPAYFFTSNYLFSSATIGGFIGARITNNSTSDIGLIIEARTKANSVLTQGSIVSFRSNVTDFVQIRHNGNMVLQNGGTFTDSGERLQVTGDVKFGTAFKWDNTNGRLGIETNAPEYKIDISYTSVSATGNNAIRVKSTDATSTAEFRVENNLGNSSRLFKLGSSYSAYKILNGNDLGFYNSSAAGDISILNDFATGNIKFAAGASATAHMTLHNTGNLLIGSTTNSGERLQVSGNTKILGAASTSASNALVVQNSSATNLISIRNDGFIEAASGVGYRFSNDITFSSVTNGSFMTGYRSSATGSYSFSANGGMSGIGGRNQALGNMSAAFGRNSIAYLTGQFSHSSFGVGEGQSQHSFIQLFRDITGVSQSELFIDGSSARAILPVANSMWNAKIYILAVCRTAGGTTILGDVFSGEYLVTIKRVGSVTSLVGSVTSTDKSDASMSTSIITIDANDTNDAIRIQFTPPTTSDASTVIRVLATLHLTEVRY